MSLTQQEKIISKHAPESLWSRDFILLFIITMFSTCYMAVYYCLEQWMEHVMVAPGWRGILLGSFFGIIMIARPFASVLLLKANKLPPMLVSVLVINAIFLVYQYLDPASQGFVWVLLLLRIVQGFFMAIFSACSVALLVSCIPPGQSARGFAIFSLTFLIPYAVIPSIGEYLLPILGGEPVLFAWTAAITVPSLIILYLMRAKLREPEVPVSVSQDFRAYRRDLLHSVSHSGLGLIYLALLCFGLCTSTCIYFIKGLCSLTGGDPAQFFFYYAATIVILRMIGSRLLDRLPGYTVVPVTAFVMFAALLVVAWGPLSLYGPATIVFAVSLSMLYPIEASIILNRSTPDTKTVNSNLMNTMFDAASLLSPIAGGVILSLGFSYHAVITMSAVTILLSGIFFRLDGARQSRLERAD
ncbi:MAG: MFS transporter [Desulfovibrionaceae bacterium]|nr:MFS transporter [Desulfovibrionaceae bacterium]